MILKVITSEQTKIYPEIIWVELTTTTGNFIILPGHAPLIVTLIPDKPIIFMQKDEKTEMIHLQRSAILECVNDEITVLI